MEEGKNPIAEKHATFTTESERVAFMRDVLDRAIGEIEERLEKSDTDRSRNKEVGAPPTQRQEMETARRSLEHTLETMGGDDALGVQFGDRPFATGQIDAMVKKAGVFTSVSDLVGGRRRRKTRKTRKSKRKGKGKSKRTRKH